MARKLSWFSTDHVGVLLPKIKKNSQKYQRTVGYPSTSWASCSWRGSMGTGQHPVKPNHTTRVFNASFPPQTQPHWGDGRVGTKLSMIYIKNMYIMIVSWYFQAKISWYFRYFQNINLYYGIIIIYLLFWFMNIHNNLFEIFSFWKISKISWYFWHFNIFENIMIFPTVGEGHPPQRPYSLCRSPLISVRRLLYKLQ